MFLIINEFEAFEFESDLSIFSFFHKLQANYITIMIFILENLSVGGPSPMMTGLVIAMSALFNRGKGNA